MGANMHFPFNFVLGHVALTDGTDKLPHLSRVTNRKLLLVYKK